MRVKPEIAYFNGKTPVYKCSCGAVFRRIDLMSNKPTKGTRDYCPNCKVKLVF